MPEFSPDLIFLDYFWFVIYYYIAINAHISYFLHRLGCNRPGIWKMEEIDMGANGLKNQGKF